MDSVKPVQDRPSNSEDFLKSLAAARGGLPKRLVQCADFILEHPERVALSTVAEIASGAGVSPSALMRFAQAMGFEGYSDMQRMFRASIKRELPDYSTRLKHLQEAGAGSPSALLAEFVEAGRSSLEALAAGVDPRVLDMAVGRLATANLIHIVGMRRAFPVASYMSYAFEKMEIPAFLHQNSAGLTFSHSVGVDDAVIAITFAPYSGETLEFIDHAAGLGVPVCVITDRRSLLPTGEMILPIYVAEVDFGAFRSLSATLTVAISLAVSVGSLRRG